ncbi:10236_t:CDS:2 [Funneliformis caledonium]|uniref:10236_t:CDS:1 n=1 Tax=Funneliformis caledonium TaxID=1117310 RepID=A0A9N9DI25_9GLOM|nr:10236_t:CDS:2 [Funneliformis caledonium]
MKKNMLFHNVKLLGILSLLVQLTLAQEDDSFRVTDSFDTLITALLSMLIYLNLKKKNRLKGISNLVEVIIHTIFFVIAFRRFNNISNDVFFIIFPYIISNGYAIYKSVKNLHIIRRNNEVTDISISFQDINNRLATFNEDYDLKFITFIYYTYSGLILATLCASSSLWLKSYMTMVVFSRAIADKKSEIVNTSNQREVV